MGKVLGIHHVTLRPDVNTAAFEAFVETTLAPIYRRVRGQDLLLLRGDRGAEAGRHLLVVLLDDPATRDRHYPAPGIVSQELLDATAGTEEVWDTLDSFVESFPDPDYTDYVVLAGQL